MAKHMSTADYVVSESPRGQQGGNRVLDTRAPQHVVAAGLTRPEAEKYADYMNGRKAS